MPFARTKVSALILALTLSAYGYAMPANAQNAPQTPPTTPAEQNLQTGQAFLAKTAAVPGVVVLPSGVMYKTVSRSPNPGAQPSVADQVTIHYEGTLLDGSVFDSSYKRNEPATFPLNRLIMAWQQVIPLMHVGDEIVLYTPPTAAYGERDLGQIPPNSTLIFKVKLLGIGGQ